MIRLVGVPVGGLGANTNKGIRAQILAWSVALLGTVHAVCARSAAISFPNFSLRAWCLKLELRLFSILELRLVPILEGLK